jgi:hypothetical protein
LGGLYSHIHHWCGGGGGFRPDSGSCISLFLFFCFILTFHLLSQHTNLTLPPTMACLGMTDIYQVEGVKICVVMVGLPARGKSLIAQKGKKILTCEVEAELISHSRALPGLALNQGQDLQRGHLPACRYATTNSRLLRHEEYRRRAPSSGCGGSRSHRHDPVVPGWQGQRCHPGRNQQHQEAPCMGLRPLRAGRNCLHVRRI